MKTSTIEVVLCFQLFLHENKLHPNILTVFFFFRKSWMVYWRSISRRVKLVQHSHNPAALTVRAERALLIKLPQPCVYFKLSGGHKNFFSPFIPLVPNKSFSGWRRRRDLGQRERGTPAVGGPSQPALGRAGAKKINSPLWHRGWAMPLCDRGRRALVSVTELSLPPPPHITPHQCPPGVGRESRTRGGVSAEHSLRSQPAERRQVQAASSHKHVQPC